MTPVPNLTVVRTNPTPDVEGFAICADVAEGNTAVSAFQRHGVSHGQFWHWTEHHDKLREAWHRARLSQAHALADQALDLADEPISYGDMAAVNRQRLRVDTRKWYTSKIAPKIFGDRVEHDHTHRVGVVLLPPVALPAQALQASQTAQVAQVAQVQPAHSTAQVTATASQPASTGQASGDTTAPDGTAPDGRNGNKAETGSGDVHARSVDRITNVAQRNIFPLSAEVRALPEAETVEAGDSQSRGEVG